MPMNIMQFVQMLKSGNGNPQPLLINMMQQKMGGTPVGDNLISLAQQGKSADIEQIARNLCASKGINFEEAFTNFKQQLGL